MIASPLIPPTFVHTCDDDVYFSYNIDFSVERNLLGLPIAVSIIRT